MSVYKVYGHYNTNTCQITEIDESRFRLKLAEDLCRFGGFTDEQIEDGATGYSFVDPSGGPFISVGHPLNELHKNLPAKRITKIELTEEGIVLHV